MPGKVRNPYECLLPLPLPCTQEWWEKHNGWEHYSALPPLAFKRPTDRASLRLTEIPFPLPENKQRKSALLKDILLYSCSVCCCCWNSLNLTITRRTHLEGADVTCCDLNRRFDPRQQLRSWVSFFFSSDSPLQSWYSFFPAVLPTSCQHLLTCTPVQYGNLVPECCVFDFAKVGRCESPVSKAQTAEQRLRLVVTAERTN